jgi:hypothetical protein
LSALLSTLKTPGVSFCQARDITKQGISTSRFFAPATRLISTSVITGRSHFFVKLVTSNDKQSELLDEAILRRLPALLTLLSNIKRWRAPFFQHLSFFKLRIAPNARACTSARSIGFCAIWVCISSSLSSSRWHHQTTINTSRRSFFVSACRH